MILDDAAQERLGLSPGGRRLFTILDCLVGDEPPGIGLGVAELGGIFLHPGTGPVVLVATDLHGQKPPADQVVVCLPAP